jgi:hypothetical protein
MSNPTTPFGWQMPTATDLVTDLPADFEVFGQAVATSMADLLGGTTGQILAKNSATDMDFVWIANDQGDITGITATSPLTGGGTSGAITVGIQDATTSVKGSVQLSDSTSTTSSVLAATPTAVKSAFDLADAAIAKTTVTTAGDLIYRNATVPVRLGIGTAGQVLTVNSGATAPEWATPSGGSNLFYAGKNKIINGDFGIWQRGTSFTSTGYTADRFTYTQNGSTCTVSQQTFTPGTAPVAGYEGQYFARSAVTSVAGASNYVWFRQLIENVRVFANQTITISFWAKADGAKPISIEWEQNFGSGGSASVQTFVAKPTLTTSWARYSYTIAVPSIAGKTLAASTWSHLAFWLDAGSTYNTRTNSLGQQNITFDVWGVQVEAGSTATDFVTASGGSPQAELAMCQRYYYRNTSGAAYVNMGIGAATSTTASTMDMQFPVTMRTAPTSVDFSTLRLQDFAAGYAVTTLTIGTNGTGFQMGEMTANVASGLTSGKVYWIGSNNSSTGYIAFSAEL